jgi:SEC-C motif
MITKISSALNPFKNVGRNDPCPCGSGRKFKKCCLGKSELEFREDGLPPELIDALSAADLPNDDDPWGEDDIEGYDPLVEPDPEEWLALDEQERISLVEAYHEAAGIDLPNAAAHAIFHAIVENQIAEGDSLPVKRVAQRLMSEGLDRHEAIHAIGSVLAVHLNDLMREVRSNAPSSGASLPPDPNVRYYAELERLTADKWRRSG